MKGEKSYFESEPTASVPQLVAVIIARYGIGGPEMIVPSG